MEFSTWVMDNLLGVFSSLTTVVLFFIYFKLNRRQKEAEVKQTEAGVKQSEGGALTTMQGAYDEFTKDYMEKWNEVKEELLNLKQSDKEKGVVIDDMKRQMKGLTREVGETKQVLTDVEKIACIKLACKDREPAMGEYKHNKVV